MNSSHKRPADRAATPWRAVAKRWLVLLLGAALPLAVAPGAFASAPSSWQDLWANQNTAARAAFTAELKKNPSDSDARCGLALLEIERDSSSAAVADLAPIYKQAPSSWQASAYWPVMAQLAESCGKWDTLTAAANEILASKTSVPELRASARLV